MGYNDKCEGYTGADLAALIKEAGMEALKEIIAGYGQPEITMQHIYRAFDKVQPSVREKASIYLIYMLQYILDNNMNNMIYIIQDIKYYEKFSKLYSIKKNSEVTPMETPIDAPIVDVVMEPMET